MLILKILHIAILVIYLVLCSYTDIRNMTISLPLSIVCSLIGCIFRFVLFIPKASFFSFIISISIGIFLILLSIISHNMIGVGDGMIFVTTGTFLSFANNISMLFYGLLLTSFYALYKLIVTRKRKTIIPFAPFLLFGYSLVLIT